MSTSNTTVLVDGQMVKGLQGDGAIQSYFNDAMNSEVSYQTSGIGAWQSSNLSDRHRQNGLAGHKLFSTPSRGRFA